MSDKEMDDGGPAFPQTFRGDEARAAVDYGLGGMTLRDWFAGQALNGMLANQNREYDFGGAGKDAYAFADAMIAERKKS